MMAMGHEAFTTKSHFQMHSNVFDYMIASKSHTGSFPSHNFTGDNKKSIALYE